MLKFPSIDPVIVKMGPLAISWYSIAYVVGILIAWYYAGKLILLTPISITKKHIEDFIPWAIIGIIIGGRIGHVLFYDPVKYFHNPIEILKTYEGGMSFHGGIIGITISTFFYCKKNKIKFLSMTDIISVTAPIGLFLGRIANFINAELYGKITNVPWAVIFPNSDGMPRHPSQLYEAFMEGFILFFIMLYFIHTKLLEKPGKLSAIFLIFYGIFRFVIEFFKEQDLQIGYILGQFTLGQLLCIPMILLGVYLLTILTNAKNIKKWQ